MSITAQELQRLVDAERERSESYDEDSGDPAPDSAFYEYGDFYTGIKYNDCTFPVRLSDDVFITALVEEYGGSGQGDDFWVVFSVTTPSGTQLFRVDGWYQSYAGGELDGDPYEVEPVEKIVTFYERKKN